MTAPYILYCQVLVEKNQIIIGQVWIYKQTNFESHPSCSSHNQTFILSNTSQSQRLGVDCVLTVWQWPTLTNRSGSGSALPLVALLCRAQRGVFCAPLNWGLFVLLKVFSVPPSLYRILLCSSPGRYLCPPSSFVSQSSFRRSPCSSSTLQTQPFYKKIIIDKLTDSNGQKNRIS